MSDRDKKLLIYLGAVIIVAMAYFFVGRPYLDKLDKVNFEKSELQRELNAKRELVARQDEFISGIEESNAQMQKIIDQFPEDNSDEKSIMFVANAEKEIPTWVGQIKFAEIVESAIKPESASEQEAQAEAEAVAANEEGSEALSERGTDENAPGQQESSTGLSGLMGRNTQLGLKFKSKYDGFKNLMAYVRDYEDRMVISEMEVTYDIVAGIVDGSMTLSQFALLGPGRELPAVETGVEDLGKDNVFVIDGYSKSIIDLIGEIARDLVDAIVGGLNGITSNEEENYFISVTTLTDNTNAKTVGRAKDPSGTTYITSDSNDKESVTFTLAGSGGRYHGEYDMAGYSVTDDDFSKDTSGHAVLRVISSTRKDSGDKSAISLHLRNNSDIPLIVNIENDDPENPRVEIADTEGDITVNK